MIKKSFNWRNYYHIKIFLNFILAYFSYEILYCLFHQEFRIYLEKILFLHRLHVTQCF